MGQTREEKLINALKGKQQYEPKTPIATDMFLPNHSGIAVHPEFKEALGDYVPYSGASANVNLGSYNLTTTGTLTAASSPGIGITGEIRMWTTASAPTGWLICNGAAISRTTYANLFAVIGTTYGAGNGTTTFNIPNTQGKFIIGVNGTYTLASTGGSVNTSSGTANVSDSGHTHDIDNTGVSYESGINTVSIAANTFSDDAAVTDSGHTHDNSLPPYLAINFIIKT